MLITILHLLAAFFLAMAIPAYMRPDSFALCARGWRDSRTFCAAQWAGLACMFFGLGGILSLHAKTGWTTTTTIAAVLTFGAAAISLHSLWQTQTPLYTSDAERLMDELEARSKGLAPEERRALHARIRQVALDEIDHLAAEVDRERPENWEEVIIRLAVNRSLWEELPERFPEEFPPKARP